MPSIPQKFHELFESAHGRPAENIKELKSYAGYPITDSVDCGDSLPRTKIRAGHYLVHNHVRPVKPLGQNGFRAWVTDDNTDLVACDCNFGGCKNRNVNPHYRVRRDEYK
jgi:hypothetical protein